MAYTETWHDSEIKLYSGEFKDNIDGAAEDFSDEWKYTNAIQEGLRIWIAKDYRALHYPIELYGEFFSEDALIILHTSTDKATCSLIWELHIWIGKNANKETYATALYKANDLDEHLGFKCEIHRHSEGYETEHFCAMFPTLTFRFENYTRSYWYQQRDTYSAKLLRINRTKSKHYTINEVEPIHSELDPAFVFIMDIGNSVFMRVGCLVDQKDFIEAVNYAQYIRNMRQITNRLEIITENDESDNQHQFYNYLTHKTMRKQTKKGFNAGASVVEAVIKLTKITNTDAGTELKNVKTKNGKITQHDLDECNMAIYDDGKQVFFKLGENTDDDDKIQVLELIHIYLKNLNLQNKTTIIYKNKQPDSMKFY